MGGIWTRPCIIWNSRTSLRAAVPTSAIGDLPKSLECCWCCGGGLVSIVLRDVGPSLVGGWVLPHEGTILQKHIRHAGEPGCCIVSP